MQIEAAGSVGRMHGKNYLAAQHARLMRRRGMGRAKSPSRSMLVRPTGCSNATSPTTTSEPTGTAAESNQAHTRRLVAQLERLGHKVIIDPTA